MRGLFGANRDVGRMCAAPAFGWHAPSSPVSFAAAAETAAAACSLAPPAGCCWDVLGARAWPALLRTTSCTYALLTGRQPWSSWVREVAATLEVWPTCGRGEGKGEGLSEPDGRTSIFMGSRGLSWHHFSTQAFIPLLWRSFQHSQQDRALRAQVMATVASLKICRALTKLIDSGKDAYLLLLH